MAHRQNVIFLAFEEEQMSCHSKFANNVPRAIFFVEQNNFFYAKERDML
jgi:hypothetical protein